jgi:hypothetical protein
MPDDFDTVKARFKAAGHSEADADAIARRIVKPAEDTQLGKDMANAVRKPKKRKGFDTGGAGWVRG